MTRKNAYHKYESVCHCYHLTVYFCVEDEGEGGGEDRCQERFLAGLLVSINLRGGEGWGSV